MRAHTLSAILLFVVSEPAALAQQLRVESLPTEVTGGRSSWIIAKLTGDKKEGVSIKFEITDNSPCSSLNSEETTTNKQGEAKVTFTGAEVPDNCPVTVGVTANTTPPQTGQAIITVKPSAPETVTIEPTTAITIILIASFAIDRTVTLVLFLMPFLAASGESRDNAEARKRREKLIYVLLAFALGLLLGYFGEIRLLEGLGFSKNLPVNALLTALILTAGSDSISTLLKRIGGHSGGEGEPKPLVIQGDLTLQRPSHPKSEPGVSSSSTKHD